MIHLTGKPLTLVLGKGVHEAALAIALLPSWPVHGVGMDDLRPADLGPDT